MIISKRPTTIFFLSLTHTDISIYIACSYFMPNLPQNLVVCDVDTLVGNIKEMLMSTVQEVLG